MKNNRILVVDNEIVTLTMLKSTMSKAGYEVIAAASGTEAVNLAKEHLPFVIILDIMMPGMDGGDVADILKSDRKTREIPIIFLSSLISPREERFSTQKGGISLMESHTTRIDCSMKFESIFMAGILLHPFEE